jgi:cation diffusion facilitator CzcD-associated flavoprotein CzcO
VYTLYETLGIGFVGWRPAMKPLRAAAMWNLRRAIQDPQLRLRLTPDYPFGCKRVLFSNDYYPALARHNVELVTARIESACATGLKTADQRSYEVDAVILGTGFAATELLAPMDIVGRAGMRLADVWCNGPEAYLGIAVAGFPNLFMLYGPNTNLGHNSIIYMLESQIRYVMQAIAHLNSAPGTCLEVSAQAQARYNSRLQQALARTVWSSGCRSWYMSAQGRIVSNWSGFTFTYRRMTRIFDATQYEVVRAKQPQPLTSRVLSH